MLTLERDRERPAPARNSSSPRQSVQAFTIRTEEAVQPDAIPGGPPSAVTTNAEPSVSGSISGLLFDAAQPGETSIGSVENSIAESTEDFDSDGPTAPNSGGSNSGSSTAKFNSAPLHSRTLPLPRLHVPRAPQRVKTAQGGSPDSAQILRYLTTHSRVQSADTSPKQAPLSPPATGLATPYVAPEVDIEKLDVNFKVWMQARDGSPKREMRCEVNTAQVETVEDLKRAVLEYIQAQETNVVADKYLKGTLRLKNSAVQFADQHPTSYLLFFFLCSSPKPDLMQTYEIDVELDLHPNTFSEPKKAAYFLKPSGAFHRMAKKYFVLQHGTLYYGKDESQALDHMKHIQLSQVSFDVRDAKDRTIILEFKDSNLKMQALSDEDKAEWMAELRLLCMVSAECRQAKGDVAMRGRKAKFCATCKESFSIFRRPHVCHTCGLSFCENDFYPKDRVCKADKRESCEVSHSSLINSGPAAVREAADIAQQSGLTCSFSLLTEKDHSTKSGSPRTDLAPARSPTIERLAAQAANAKPDNLAAGVLVINVIQAMGLMIADTGGSSDPYAVIYFEDKEYRTKTIMTTLNPEWKESFVINTRGAQNIVHIGVFDWDRTKKDDFLGMISIPLTALQNGKYYDKWYPLQRRPGKYGEHDKGVTGSIHIGLSYSYSIKSLFQPIIPDDVALAKRLASGEDITPELQQLQKSTAKFSFKELGYNFSRADALVKALQLDKRAKSISDILSWKSPAYTMFCLFIYLYMCAYFPARMVPALPFLLLLYVLISNLINAMFFECEIVQDGGATVLNPVLKEHQDNLKRSSSHESSSGTPRQAPPSRPDSPHEEIEEKEVLEDAAQFDDEPEEKGGGIGGAYKAAKKTLLNIQVTVGEICTMGESVQTLFTWKDPVKSAIVCGGLFALSIVVMIIPMRLAIALAGVHRFTKHLKKRWEAIKFFRSQPDGKAEGPKVDRLARRPSGNPVINFLSHVPAPWELAPDEHHLPEQLKKIS